MKSLIVVVLLLSLVSCQKSNTVVTDAPDISATDSVITPPKPFVKESPLYLIDSVTVDGKMFTVVQAYPGSKSELDLRILHKGDTIYRHNSIATNGFEFEDFDGDGTKDIRMHFVSNIDGYSELIMFDKDRQIFKAVKHFELFPEPEKISGTKYWYSYHSSGCADSNWDSDLFYIKNFEAIAIGTISGKFCVDEAAKGISIYKLNLFKPTLIQHLKEEPDKYSDKWDFIKGYWNDNYNTFQ